MNGKTEIETCDVHGRLRYSEVTRLGDYAFCSECLGRTLFNKGGNLVQEVKVEIADMPAFGTQPKEVQ